MLFDCHHVFVKSTMQDSVDCKRSIGSKINAASSSLAIVKLALKITSHVFAYTNFAFCGSKFNTSIARRIFVASLIIKPDLAYVYLLDQNVSSINFHDERWILERPVCG